jgi:hypothetical protein
MANEALMKYICSAETIDYVIRVLINLDFFYVGTVLVCAYVSDYQG